MSEVRCCGRFPEGRGAGPVPMREVLAPFPDGGLLVRQGSGDHAGQGPLKTLITTVFADPDETYGYRRVAAQLARYGVSCGPELVRALMRELGLVPCQPGSWRTSLTDGRDAGSIPDLVRQDFTAAEPATRWWETSPTTVTTICAPFAYLEQIP